MGAWARLRQFLGLGDEARNGDAPWKGHAQKAGNYEDWARHHLLTLDALGGEEDKRIKARRATLRGQGLLTEAQNDAPPIGLALSGGGIRSATFSLGLIRELGAQGLLHRFDYLSTVSGGSYAGSYYCGLFAPRKDDEPLLTARDFPDPFKRVDGEANYGRASLDWLRQAGRYLAPSGAGDYWYAVGMLVRNWIGVQIVVGSACMLLALIAVAFRFALYQWVWPGLSVDPSLLLVLAPLLILLAIPTAFHVAFGWAYWMTRRDLDAAVVDRLSFAQFGSILICVGTFFVWLECPTPPGHIVGVGRVALLVSLAALAGMVTLAISMVRRREAEDRETLWDRRREFLTRPLWRCASGFATILAVGLVDALGFVLYSLAGGAPLYTLTLPPLVTAVTVPIGRWLLKELSAIAGSVAKPASARDKNGAQQPDKGSSRDGWLKLGTTVAATVLILAVLSFWVMLAYQATWPLASGTPGSGAQIPWQWGLKGAFDVWAVVRMWGGWFVALLVLGVFIAKTPAFLNLSGLTNFYAGRLKRAYLGASNRSRLDAVKADNRGRDGTPDPDILRRQALDRSDRRDDILLYELNVPTAGYYALGSPAPLHLINITLNETRGTGSNIVQQDRHGRNLCVSPEGIYFDSDNSGRIELTRFHEPGHEALPLSTWIAISGAAFSTGLGSRTGFPLSPLAGLANVRLGYWWRARAGILSRPTQLDLLREFRGDFSGPAEKFWYLSDGGHFENTGAYELLRRAVPFIVISDNGMDQRFEYEDIANLVRKARIDFDCEIDFLGKDELDALFEGNRPELRQAFGSLTQIAGGEPAAPRAVAALARVTYAAGYGTILLIKPRLTGDGPADLIRYKSVNVTFPQQTTIDQFFDEAQWESYFHLGRLIGQAVFKAAPAGGTGWSPADLTAHWTGPAAAEPERELAD